MRDLFAILQVAIIAAAAVFSTRACRAAVVVLANRTAEPIHLDVLIDDHAARTLAIAPGDSRPFYANHRARIRGMQNGEVRELSLDPNCAYYIGPRPDGQSVALQQIGLGETPGRGWPAPAQSPLELPEAGVFSVKILVDDDEVRTQQAWEFTIRQRIAKASEALDAHCGIRLKVTAVGTWDSDDSQTDFLESLAEFEREVSPNPATIAIGFSSQFVIAKGRVHLGGTRGPLHSHILIKERARNVLEPERLELLVHELGHFLAASHSPEPHSVMRPVIGQGIQRFAGARIQFDPPNTLLLAMMGQEIRQRRVRSMADVSPDTRRRMAQIYKTLDPTLPDDPAAGQYQHIVAAAGAGPLVADARKVYLQIARVAKVQQKLRELPPADGKGTSETPPAESDKLLELYVQQAALAAKKVRRENGPRAMVLALGVALDDAGALRKLPLANKVAAHIESQPEHAELLASLGGPTMRGRADLAKHFFVSAYLVALAGSDSARNAGLVKEMLDAQGGSGFSFADMAANRAGIVFANAVLTGRLSLDDVARRFTVDAFLPPVDDLREELGNEQFLAGFGGFGDARLTAELARIEARIGALPIYQTAAPKASP